MKLTTVLVWTLSVGIILVSGGRTRKRWIPERYSDEDYAFEVAHNAGAYDSNYGPYDFYYTPANALGDYSGAYYRANDNPTSHAALDPVSQLRNVQAYSYAQTLLPYRPRSHEEMAARASAINVNLLGTHSHAPAATKLVLAPTASFGASPQIFQLQSTATSNGQPVFFLANPNALGTVSTVNSQLLQPGAVLVKVGNPAGTQSIATGGNVLVLQEQPALHKDAVVNVGLLSGPSAAEDLKLGTESFSAQNHDASLLNVHLLDHIESQGAAINSHQDPALIRLSLGSNESPQSGFAVVEHVNSEPLIQLNALSHQQPADFHVASVSQQQEPIVSLVVGHSEPQSEIALVNTNAATQQADTFALVSSDSQSHPLIQANVLSSPQRDFVVALSGAQGAAVEQSKSAGTAADISSFSPEQLEALQKILATNVQAQASTSNAQKTSGTSVSASKVKKTETVGIQGKARAYDTETYAEPQKPSQDPLSTPLDLIYPGVNSALTPGSSSYQPLQYAQPYAQPTYYQAPPPYYSPQYPLTYNPASTYGQVVQPVKYASSPYYSNYYAPAYSGQAASTTAAPGYYNPRNTRSASPVVQYVYGLQPVSVIV